MVPVADAILGPNTVVIHFHCTLTALAAMSNPWRLEIIAMLAFLLQIVCVNLFLGFNNLGLA